MSAVARGTAYELHVVRALTQIGIRARMRGGAGDGGVDLCGSWSHGDAGQKDSQQVLVQCKLYSKPLGPSVIRELVASFDQWTTPRFEATPSIPTPPPQSQVPSGQGTAAFIISSSGLTPSAKRLLILSPVPLVGVHLYMGDLRPRSVIWNHAFQSRQAPWALARLQRLLAASAENG